MPDLTTEYFSVCPSNFNFHTRIRGKTDTYDVTYGYSSTGECQYGWTCTCPQFKFRKQECKHIKEAKSERCGWNEEAFCGSGAPRPKDGKCPQCGAELDTIKVAV